MSAPDREWIDAWLEYAKGDLGAAQKLLEEDSLDPRHAALHIWQAIDKSIKAVLIAEGVDPPLTHDLEKLMDALPSSKWKGELRRTVNLQVLSSWAAGSRYPALIAPIAHNLVRSAFEGADSFVQEVARRITLCFKAREEASDSMIKVAARKSLITYPELVAEISSLDLEPHSEYLSHMLGEISKEEHEARRGMLTVVVVRKDGNRPGRGFFQLARSLGYDTGDEETFWKRELENVYRIHNHPCALL